MRVQREVGSGCARRDSDHGAGRNGLQGRGTERDASALTFSARRRCLRKLDKKSTKMSHEFIRWRKRSVIGDDGFAIANPNSKLTHYQTMKKYLVTIAALTLAISAPRGANAADIVDVAAGNESFSTLVAAVKAAGLVETLKGDGPFTVFAPTNEAFAKLPEGTVADLLKPENKEKLVAILTYHVVAGKVMAADVKAGEVATVQGSKATLTTDGGVKIDGAKVVTADIAASNGVIHVIDTVILPKS